MEMPEDLDDNQWGKTLEMLPTYGRRDKSNAAVRLSINFCRPLMSTVSRLYSVVLFHTSSQSLFLGQPLSKTHILSDLPPFFFLFFVAHFALDNKHTIVLRIS